jgi:predicted TIM-barrel fold metal-dependent hydrolase
VNSVVDELPLIDHHCHGVVRDDLGRSGLEAMLTEADASGPLHGSLFDTQIGMGVRAICAPLLELERFAPADEYIARRAELGWEDVTRRMLAGTGIAHYLVDTGFLADVLTTPSELAGYTDARASEIVRLETVGEGVLAQTEPAGFADAVRTALHDRAPTAAGFKSVAAYRVGLDLDPARPSDTEVAEAAADVLRAGTADRIAHSTLTRFLIWAALDIGLPLQFHVAYGDSDVDLHRCDPLLLTPLLRASSGLGVPVMLLHNYPFQRSAGYLAQVFDHVFVDVGLTLHNVGVRADVVLAELLELAPFGSVLFSSDGFGLPEIYAVNTTLFRRALTHFLDDGIAREYWSVADAERVAVMICSGNAERAYRLGAS